MLKSVKRRVLQRDATLKEQESPQAPISALSTIHMHRPENVSPAGMPHRHVHIAEPADKPIAAKTVSIDRATTLDMPEQDRGDCPTASIPLSQEEGPA